MIDPFNKLLPLYFVVAFHFFAVGQGNSSKNNVKKYKTLEYYYYGLYMPELYRDCKKKIREKYGFEDVPKAGCTVTSFQVFKWETHNRFVDWKLNKRHGKGWRQKFDDEVEKCIDENYE